MLPLTLELFNGKIMHQIQKMIQRSGSACTAARLLRTVAEDPD
jgi:hypothetical protein